MHSGKGIQTPEIKLAHNYVSNWEEMKANASGLLIWGDVGTGKSFFAGCIANALLEKSVPVLMTNFSRILNTSLQNAVINSFVCDISGVIQL